ncbi:MAG: DNRLRE domain-containing protein, partial [Bacilli bacterium]|nr:DNRLRE domain-containing protein [Bacilli bacterium]
MEEIELVKKRKKREKHFLQKDGSIKAEVYSNDVHFYKNGEYLEIDNTLVKKNDYYRNLANDYKVYFKDSNGSYLMKLRRGNNYVSMKFDNANFVDVEKDDSTSNLEKKVFYKNILDGIDLEYMVMPTKVKETIILRDKKKIRDKVRFIVRSNLKLILKDNYIILESKNKERFTMEVPYMIDSNGIKNENVRYQLRRRLYYYELDLIFDRGWLEDESRVYPVYIDPTITNSEQKDNVYDTYIYNRGPVYNPNHLDSLKAGVDRQDGIDITYRTLLKFNLPNLGTSDEIIEAHLNLVSYPEFTSSRFPKLVEIHRLTKDFDEELATWDDMYDKYDQRIEGLYYCYRSRIDPTIEIGKEILVPGAVLINGRITDLVKKWYTGTPNYGIMLKASNEVYEDDNYPMFFSKSNSIEGSNPKPVLVITYRNQNGLEGYLDYKSQSLSNGTVYQNTFNGNLTAVFNIGSTIGGRFPTSISLVYNTNDVILNKETTYGKGNKLSLDQTVKKAFIDGVNYLEYVDEDGTLHYFYEENDGDVSTYHDEDGLDLVVKQEDNSYIMLDKTGGVMKFVIKSGVGYLSEIVDVSNNKIEIVRNSNNYVTKVIDGNNQEIILSYNGSVIEVVSPDSTVKLNYQNSKLIKLETRDGSTLFTYNQNGLISKITDVTGRSFGYTYYSEKPYKVMSVFEYGLNNVEGASFTLKYGFNTTSIVDYKGRVTTLVYNSNGNVISSNSMEKNDDIRSAYSVVKQYGEEDNKNKLLSNMIPVRYVKNYLKNT